MSNGYLLPLQTLLDLCDDDPKSVKAKTWADKADTSQQHVSVISAAQMRAHIDIVTDAIERRTLNFRMTNLLATLIADAGPLLPFDEGVSLVWQSLHLDPNLKGLAQTARQVYATAMRHNFAIVEEPRAEHTYLQGLGMRVVPL